MKVVEVKGLWFRYDERWILRGVDMEVSEGELVAIVGQNGCGKTTLVKHFNGLLKPVRGTVLIEGVDTREATTAQLARRVGYVFQDPSSQIFSNTIYDEVGFGPKNIGVPPMEIDGRVREALGKVGLTKPPETQPYSLSMGEKERLAIASVLSMNPKLLILDEPTTGQDYRTCRAIMRIAKEYAEKGGAVVMISHDMDLVCEWSSRVIVMHKGEIIEDGDPHEVYNNHELLQSIGLSPPQVSILARYLNIPGNPITIDEMAEMLIQGARS
ncbi:MAG: energy-coupling factor ABC transporter ATP-binding protein [Candidatus Bathyarchaeia archaeon]